MRVDKNVLTGQSGFADFGALQACFYFSKHKSNNETNIPRVIIAQLEVPNILLVLSLQWYTISRILVLNIIEP